MQSDYSKNTSNNKETTFSDLSPTPAGDKSGGDNAKFEGKQHRGLSLFNKVFVDKKKTSTINIVDRRTGEILAFDKSLIRISRMRKRIFAWADVLKPQMSDTAHYRVVMVTLTYAKAWQWRKNQIREFMLSIRKICGKNLVGYAWVAELQERGAVHYHVELVVKKGTRIPKPDDSGLWKWGLTRIETAKTHFYICKYVGKEHQKTGDFPKGMRMFAVWIAKPVITEFQRWYFRLTAIPAWLSEKIKENADLCMKKWCRDPGGGWTVGDEKFTSPYMFFCIS